MRYWFCPLRDKLSHGVNADLPCEITFYLSHGVNTDLSSIAYCVTNVCRVVMPSPITPQGKDVYCGKYLFFIIFLFFC